MIKNKKAALEMSMSTIIILVLGVSMLILGIVLIRNIMCSGLQITEELSQGVKNEVKGLFGADKFGVNCVGEGGQEIKIGTGGTRKLICAIRTEEPRKYSIVVDEITSLKGGPLLKEWILKRGITSYSAVPGKDNEVEFLTLNLPSDATSRTVYVKMTITPEGSDSETHTSTFDIETTGAIRGAIC